MTQDQAASALDVGRTYLVKLEKGSKSPGKFLVEKFDLISRQPVSSGHKESVSSFEGREELAPSLSGPRGKLQAALKEAKMTPSDLAKRIGYQGRVIEELVNGRGRISVPMYTKIREVFPDLDDLLEGSDTPRIIDPSGLTGTMGDRALIRGPGTRLIPLIAEAQAGPNAAFSDDFYTHEGVSVDQDIDDRMAFALNIRGDSMEDRISPGDTVIICPSWELRNGDIVVCRVRKTDDVMCKIYQPKPGGKGMILSSYNRAYPPLEFGMRDLDWIFFVAEIRKRTRR